MLPMDVAFKKWLEVNKDRMDHTPISCLDQMLEEAFIAGWIEAENWIDDANEKV